MKEERLKILEMLQEGKITTEEALELLKQVPDEDERQYEDRRPIWEQRPPHTHYRPDFSWIEDLRNAVEETVRSGLYPDEDVIGTKREKFTFNSDIGDNIRALVFEGKNAPVKMVAYGGDRIEVEAQYKAKSGWNPYIALTEENNVYSLSYDDNALYMLGISVRVPDKAQIDSISLKTKNASILVDDMKARKIELSTKNESIKVSDTKGDSLYCETKNASIVLNDIEMREIDAHTAHSKISLDDVDAVFVRLITSNAKIDISDSDIVQLYAETSNSPLRFEDIGYRDGERLCCIDAITTNGQITIRLPREDFKCKLKASTTHGGIFSELNDMVYQANEPNYAEAQAIGYETAENKLNLNLQTTNYGIYIKR